MDHNRITADMTVGEVVRKHPQTVRVFLRNFMNCFGCNIARFHDIAAGSDRYGLDLDTLLAELNESINERKASGSQP